MDLLRRTLAPVSDEAWALIDEEAKRVLTLNLAARRLVDFDGPHGWRKAAVNLGRLDILDEQPVENVHVGLRQAQPLLELRTPIHLPIMELDTVPRGAADPELAPVTEAAENTAALEDRAVFHGYAAAGIDGIVPASPNDPIAIPDDPIDFPQAVVEATEALRRAGIRGPFGLALGPDAYDAVSGAVQGGVTVRTLLEGLIEGPVVWAPAVDGGVLLSMRGGDFVLTVGQDLSIGYANHDKQTVELYLTESMTFRVLEPAAAVHLARGT